MRRTSNNPPDHRIDPHFFLCEVPDRRALARRLAAAGPGGLRPQAQRSWAGEPRLRRGRVGVWFWAGGEAELRAAAGDVLRRFVHPLVGSGAPYCVGFPFPAEIFARRPLALEERALLDLEDIGALLEAGPAAGRRGDAASTPLPVAAAGTRGAPAAVAPEGAGDPPLDPAQHAAATHTGGPARVLAAAGAGKTKTLVARVAELVARGVDPGEILVLAFNRKAAEQLEERLAALGIATTRAIGAANNGRGAVHCATFNAFGYRYQKQIMGARFALDTQGGAARDLMAAALERAGFGAATLRPVRGSDPTGTCLAALARVRASLEPPDEVELLLPTCGERPLVPVPFAEVERHYARLQARDGRQSFDDLIYLALADLLADPRHRAAVQRLYSHVLVDEFQDLNAVQLALIDVLSRPRRDLFVVGDDDQLIYGWRFAELAGILGFHERMPLRPWSATYTLGTNYRCSQAVVAAGTRLVAHNARREAKTVRPRAGAAEGSVRIVAAAAWPERAAELCAFLRDERVRLGCAWRALAVLCRYRAQQLPLALALDLEGIPRSALLGYRLFSDPAARLLRAYVDAVVDPLGLTGAALRLLLNRPERFVPAVEVEGLATAAAPWRALLGRAAAEPAAGPRRLGTLAAAVEALAREVRGDDPADSGSGPAPARVRALNAAQVVSAVVDDFGLMRHWETADPGATEATLDTADRGGDPDAAGPRQVVDALLLLAECRPELPEFLTEWDRLLADEEAHVGMSADTLAREEAEDDRVVIGTIHAAKGREYDAVVIPEYACELADLRSEQVEEERRVLYVGVTRAREAVLITADPSRPGPPLFLLELTGADACSAASDPAGEPRWAAAWTRGSPRSGARREVER